MDRRQYAEVVQFFTAARSHYRELEDELVADECGFAIALAKRILNDLDRTYKNRNEGVLAANLNPDTVSEIQDIGINAA